MATGEARLRVSVATLDRVIFRRPSDGTLMLALERKAALLDGSGASVRAQPFGGAVRLRSPDRLRDQIGDFDFDSERSEREQDFRLLIRAADWETVKQFCIRQLQDPDDAVLESDPSRELVEEFADCLHVSLRPEQYTYQPVGTVVENNPTPTDNVYSRGYPTVRVYRIFEVSIVDQALALAMLAASERFSDTILQQLAATNAKTTGRGRANSVLTLPLKLIQDFYLNKLPEQRYESGTVDGHRLDVSVAAILEDVQLPQFLRELAY